MISIQESMGGERKARGDVAADRSCLRCKVSFRSEGFGERVCPRCKGTISWRSSVPAVSGQGSRRSSGRSS